MISRDGDRMRIAGPVTLQNVTQLLEEGLAHVREGATEVDLAGVSDLDSSLLAAILAWMREAGDRNAALAVRNVPDGLVTLAQLYGVEQLLPVRT